MTNYKGGYNDTQEAIQKANPKFIIVMPNQPTIPYSLYGYLNAVTIENVIIYERAL